MYDFFICTFSLVHLKLKTDVSNLVVHFSLVVTTAHTALQKCNPLSSDAIEASAISTNIDNMFVKVHLG